jgi:toluene monooxygenase system ferredoxin subunit
VSRSECLRAWTEVLSSDELWDGEMVPVRAEDNDLLLIKVDGNVRAYEDRCPHQRTPLSDGDLTDGVVTCPSHLWEFDAMTGQGLNPATCALRSFAVKVEDGVIHVDLSPLPQ